MDGSNSINFDEFIDIFDNYCQGCTLPSARALYDFYNKNPGADGCLCFDDFERLFNKEIDGRDYIPDEEDDDDDMLPDDDEFDYDCDVAFNEADTDMSFSLSPQEFSTYLENNPCDCGMSAEELFNEYASGEGEMSYVEFCQFYNEKVKTTTDDDDTMPDTDDTTVNGAVTIMFDEVPVDCGDIDGIRVQFIRSDDSEIDPIDIEIE